MVKLKCDSMVNSVSLLTAWFEPRICHLLRLTHGVIQTDVTRLQQVVLCHMVDKNFNKSFYCKF